MSLLVKGRGSVLGEACGFNPRGMEALGGDVQAPVSSPFKLGSLRIFPVSSFCPVLWTERHRLPWLSPRYQVTSDK